MRSAFETDLAEACAPRQCNVGLLAYSPLAGGALSGKYIKGSQGHEKARFNIFPGYMERCAAEHEHTCSGMAFSCIFVALYPCSASLQQSAPLCVQVFVCAFGPP